MDVGYTSDFEPRREFIRERYRMSGVLDCNLETQKKALFSDPVYNKKSSHKKQSSSGAKFLLFQREKDDNP